MNYKKFFIILFLFIYGCQPYNIDKQENVLINKKNFINRGFAIVYNDDLYNQKIVSKKIDGRSLIIFQKNLKKGTKVRVKNILNNKTIIERIVMQCVSLRVTYKRRQTLMLCYLAVHHHLATTA